LFNVDARGGPIDALSIGGRHPSVAGAIAEARRLQVTTRFRSTDAGGHIVLANSLTPATPAQAAD